MRTLRAPVTLALTLALPTSALAQYPTPAPMLVSPEENDALSDEEKIERAKKLYIEAEGYAAEGEWAKAVPLYEEAYYLVPAKHGFAHKVGVAAHKAGDCDKAYEYMTHFLTYGDEEKHGDKIDEANKILEEIEAADCRTKEPEPEPEPEPTDEENPIENPLAGGGEDPTDTGEEEKGGKGLLIGGAVLTALGAGGVGLGAAGLVIASSRVNDLQALSSSNTVTGYAEGDYACRNDAACPPDLEQQAQQWKVIGYVGLGVGGAMLLTGITLIALHVVKKKKGGGKSAKANSGPQLTGLGPVFVQGGAGAGATLRF